MSPQPTDPTPPPPEGSALPDAAQAQELAVLADWAPELAETFAALACDLALVVDRQGLVVKRAASGSFAPTTTDWVGRPWVDTAEPGSRRKLQALFGEVLASGRSRRVEVNHPGPPAAPVAWRAVRLGLEGPILAVGQDLRAQAELQQRFLAAQEALERSYWNAQRRLLDRSADETLPTMTPAERRKLGLADAPHLDDPGGEAADALALALDRLHERIGKDSLQGLLRDARRLAEQQFLGRALQRAGSLDALARSLGVSRRALLRRGGPALRHARPKP